MIERLEAVHTEFVQQLEIEQSSFVRPTQEQWRLEEKCMMTEEMMIIVAKARWIYHRQRCRLDHKQARRLNVDNIIERLREELKEVAMRRNE